MDKHYWKDAYQELWGKADEKERQVKELVENLLKEPIEFYGLGAGKTEYIKGNAKDNNLERGDADLFIKKFETFIEVTGPFIKVNKTDSLWVRPDKTRNAILKLRNGLCKHYFVIHVANLKNGNTLFRAIKLGQNIVEAFKKKSIKQITPFIRGKQEKYLEIPFNHECVFSLDEFKEIITNG